MTKMLDSSSLTSPVVETKTDRVVFTLSYVAYITALCGPTIIFEFNGVESVVGFMALLVGWMGGYVQWWANPALFFSYNLLASRKYVDACIMSGIAMVLALLTLAMDTYTIVGPGYEAPIIAFGFGFYSWLVSIAIVFAYCVFMSRKFFKQLSLVVFGINFLGPTEGHSETRRE